MTDLYELRFIWPHPEPNDVVVTGTFDNWTSSVHLQRTQSGFEGTVKVPWSSKILYKFRVDGYWVTHEQQPTEVDPAGNWNNVAYTPDKTPESNIDESDKTTLIVVKDDPEPAPPAVDPIEEATPEPAPIEPTDESVLEPAKEEPVAPPKVEKEEPTPVVPGPIEPVVEEPSEPTLKEPGEMDTPAPAPAPEPVIPIEVPAPAPEPKPEPTPAPAPIESSPEPEPAPTPAPVPKPSTETGPQPEPTKPEDPSVGTPRPVTPPPKSEDAPSSPSPPTPKPVNGHAPSTPSKGATPFPSTGSDSPGRGSIGSRTGGRKKRISIIDKLRNIFHHKDDSPERSDKASEKKGHRHSLFHSHSASSEN